MRIIKFRAKGSGCWRYGQYVHTGANPSFPFNRDFTDHILNVDNGEVHFIPITDIETIGQFTGLYDKNGKEIYEGDIVDFDDKPYCANGSKYQGVVVMHSGAWCVQHYEKCFDVHLYSPLFADDFANRKTSILGNIHDNAKLLKGDKQ